MQKDIPKYCYIEIKEEPAYILHTQAPFIIGRIWKYKQLPDLLAQIEKMQPLAFARSEHYSIAVTLWSVLGGRLEVDQNYKATLQKIMDGMLATYMEKVEKAPRFYEKFRL